MRYIAVYCVYLDGPMWGFVWLLYDAYEDYGSHCVACFKAFTMSIERNEYLYVSHKSLRSIAAYVRRGSEKFFIFSFGSILIPSSCSH